MKTSRVVFRLISSISCFLLLVAFLIASLVVDNRGGMSNSSRSYTFDVKDVDHLSIDLFSADLRVYATDSDQIQVIDKGQRRRPLEVDLSGDTLNVKREDSVFKWFNLGWGKELVEIYLPNKVFDSIQMYTVSGDVNIEDIATDYMILDTPSGDIEGNIVSDILQINTVSGDIEVGFKGNQLGIKSVSGDIEMDAHTFIEAINIDTVSGDIELGLDYNYGFTIELDTVSGEIESVVGNVIEEKRTKWKGYYKDGESVIRVKTTSGDVEIQ